MPRSKAFNRDVSYRKAVRKRRIAREVYSWSNSEWEYYDNLHQYSKNKVHCSWPRLFSKNREKGNYNRSLNYKRPDLIQQISADQQMEKFDGCSRHRNVKYW